MLRYDHLNILGKVAYHEANHDEGIPSHSHPHRAETAAPTTPTQAAPEGAEWRQMENPFAITPSRSEQYYGLYGANTPGGSEGLLGFGSQQGLSAFQKSSPEFGGGDFSSLSLYGGAPAPTGHWTGADTGQTYSIGDKKGVTSAGSYMYDPRQTWEKGINPEAFMTTGGADAFKIQQHLIDKASTPATVPSVAGANATIGANQVNTGLGTGQRVYNPGASDNTAFNTTVANIKEQFAPGKSSPGGAAMLDSIKNWDFTAEGDREQMVGALAAELNRKQFQSIGGLPSWQTPISSMSDALQAANELYDAFGGGKPAAGSPEATAEAEAKAAADKAKVYKGSTAQQTSERGLAHITSDTAKKFGISTSAPLSMDMLRSDPNYMQHVQGVANLPLDIPVGWTYEQAKYGEDGRLLTPSTLKPAQITTKDAEGVDQFGADPNAAELSSNEVRDWLTVANKKQEAQDLMLRTEQLGIDTAETGMKLESQEAISAANIASQEKQTTESIASQEKQTTESIASQEKIAGQKAFTDLRIANNANKTTKQLQDDQQDWEQEVMNKWKSDEAVLDRALQGDIQGTAAQRHTDAITRDNNTHSNTMLQITRHGEQERLNITDRGMEERIGMRTQGVQDRLTIGTQGVEERLNIQERSKAELLAIDAKGVIEKAVQTARDNGLMDRLTDQITSDELLAGNQIESTEAIAKAERTLRKTLQDDQIEAAKDTLTEEGKRDIANIQERGKEERLTFAEQETLQKALQTEEGQQAIKQIERTAEVGTEQAVSQFEQMQEAGRITTEQDIAQTRSVTSTYTTGLNNALSAATQSGDYTAVNEALAAPLPELPTGVRWDREQGFLMREGFQGREMDASTRQLTAALTPAFKARDRAEEATRQANQINLELTAQRQNAQANAELFRQHMMTGDIDSAEEAAARQKMAETAAIAANTKMEHLNTLFGLIQNPVLLGMAKRHGLLGQIESVLGFQISHVPEGPTTGFGAIPNSNEWQTMDTDEQSFSLAAFVEQGGSPDEFMRAIAGAAPAQLQQVNYGVL